VALLAVAYKDNIKVSELDKIFEVNEVYAQRGSGVIGCTLDGKCEKCNTSYAAFFRTTDTSVVADQLKQLVEIITKECTGKADEHSESVHLVR
jgi:hypothetical protein